MGESSGSAIKCCWLCSYSCVACTGAMGLFDDIIEQVHCEWSWLVHLRTRGLSGDQKRTCWIERTHLLRVDTWYIMLGVSTQLDIDGRRWLTTYVARDASSLCHTAFALCQWQSGSGAMLSAAAAERARNFINLQLCRLITPLHPATSSAALLDHEYYITKSAWRMNIPNLAGSSSGPFHRRLNFLTMSSRCIRYE